MNQADARYIVTGVLASAVMLITAMMFIAMKFSRNGSENRRIFKILMNTIPAVFIFSTLVHYFTTS